MKKFLSYNFFLISCFIPVLEGSHISYTSFTDSQEDITLTSINYDILSAANPLANTKRKILSILGCLCSCFMPHSRALSHEDLVEILWNDPSLLNSDEETISSGTISMRTED